MTDWNNKEEVLITAIADSRNSFPRYFYWLQTSATNIFPLPLLVQEDPLDFLEDRLIFSFWSEQPLGLCS